MVERIMKSKGKLNANLFPRFHQTVQIFRISYIKELTIKANIPLKIVFFSKYLLVWLHQVNSQQILLFHSTFLQQLHVDPHDSSHNSWHCELDSALIDYLWKRLPEMSKKLNFFLIDTLQRL